MGERTTTEVIQEPSTGLGLDTAPPDCSTADVDFFREQAVPLLQSRCYGCHNDSGVASSTRHVLLPFDSEVSVDQNFERLRTLVVETDDGAGLLLEKPTGQTSHGGGEVVDLLSNEYVILSELVARYQEPGNCDNPGEAPMSCEPGGTYPGPSPFRRLTDLQYHNSVADLMGVSVAAGFSQTQSEPKTFVLGLQTGFSWWSRGICLR